MKKACQTLTTIISVIIIFNLFVSSALSQSFIQGRVWGDTAADVGVRLYKPYCGEDEEVGIPQLSNTLGYYAWEGLPSGSYKVVPEHYDYNFIPEVRYVQIPQPELNIYTFEAVYTCAGAGNVRFIDNNDGTVTDSCTGKVWLKYVDNCFNLTTDFNTAETAVAGLSNGECGLTDGSMDGDWTIPNHSDLLMLGFETHQQYPSAWEGLSAPEDVTWNQINAPFEFIEPHDLRAFFGYHSGMNVYVNMYYGGLDPAPVLGKAWPWRRITRY
jgi:hypothetical protein